MRSLHLDKIIPLPTTPKHALIWDANSEAPNLANAVWTIILNEILVNRISLEKIDFKRVTKIVKGYIIASITVYSNKILSREIGKLGLMDFLASNPATGV